MPRLTFRERDGDLLNAPRRYSIGHAVSGNLKMSQGIAATIARKHGSKLQLGNRDMEIGDVGVLRRNTKRNSFVFYVVTKQMHYDKPEPHGEINLTDFQNNFCTGLRGLQRVCKERNIRRLAMPRMGCGLDRLEWEYVKGRIKKIFKHNYMKIVVYTLPQKGQSKSYNSGNRSFRNRPTSSNSRK